jgi:hypothetical protein
MNFYPEGYIVEVVVPFTDLNNQPIAPTALRAALYDGEETLITDFGAISIVGASGSKTITIAANFNNLTDLVREARVLSVEMDTAAGTVRKRHSYVIEAEQTLEIMTNTFLTYESAEISVMDFVNMTGWVAADETRRRAAMVEAYNRIVRIPMKYAPRDDLGQPITEFETVIDRDGWMVMTKDAFNMLPSHFRRALRLAQVAEANELLMGDSIGRRHRSGIITETIGESSMTLRGGQIDYGLSQSALAALSGYINYNLRITRV